MNNTQRVSTPNYLTINTLSFAISVALGCLPISCYAIDIADGDTVGDLRPLSTTLNFLGDATVNGGVGIHSPVGFDQINISSDGLADKTIEQVCSGCGNTVFQGKNIDFTGDSTLLFTGIGDSGFWVGASNGITTSSPNTGSIIFQGTSPESTWVGTNYDIGTASNPLKLLKFENVSYEHLNGVSDIYANSIIMNNIEFGADDDALTTFHGSVNITNSIIDFDFNASPKFNAPITVSNSTYKVIVFGPFTGSPNTIVGSGIIDASVGGLTFNSNNIIDVTAYANLNIEGMDIGALTPGTSLTIAKSNAPISSSASVIDNSDLYNFLLSSSGNDLILTVVLANADSGSLSGGNLASWAIPAGAMLELINAQGGSTSMQSALAAIKSMIESTDKDAAIAETAPIVANAATSESIAIINQSLSTIGLRLASLRADHSGQTGISSGDITPGTAMWIQGFGRSIDQDTRGDFDGYDNDVKGLALGIDTELSAGQRVGLAYSYGVSDVDMNGSQARNTLDIDSHQITFYGSYELENYYIEGSLGIAKNSYDSVRDISFMSTQARGNWDGWQTTARVSGGYDIPVANGAIFTPVGLAQYTYLDQDSYTETGAGALNLAVDSNDTDAFTLGIGGKLSKEMEVNSTTVIPELSAMWLHDVTGNRVSTTAQFANDSGKFTTEGADPEENALQVKAGITILSDSSMTLSAMYDGEFRDDYESHGFTLNARYEF